MPTKKEKQPLSVTHPELAKEADGWDPSQVMASFSVKKSWVCIKGHFWEAQISNRISGTGCPYCSGNKVLAGFNDLASLEPELAAQALGWDPTTVTRGSSLLKLWKCSQMHEWKDSVAHRISGRGCPFCSGRRVLAGFNDLKTMEPTLASEAHGWDPSTVTRGAGGKKEWLCSVGHSYLAALSDRTNGDGCPICSGNQVLIGFNDLATTDPELSRQACGWDAQTVSRGSGVKKQWKCELGHLWLANARDRTRGMGCPTCSGRRVLAGFNDLASFAPELAKQAFGWDPTTITRSSRRALQWKCDLGHLWTAGVGSRFRGNGCPVCSGRKVLQGFNDLATTDQNLAREAHGWDPTTVTRGAEKKREWKCAEGHVWTSMVYSRAAGNGCPTCASHGFDPNSEGWLYFLTHPNWKMLQIGISNDPVRRLKSHKKNGWELLEVRGPMDGLIAREWESSILKMLRRCGASFAPEDIAGKFDGYTESWIAESFSINSLKELMQKVQDDE